MSAETDAALISYSGQLLNSSMNYAAQSSINRKTQRYNREMYDRQRQDALADWTMQNEYNSPMSQMARLREAGLNPNLVYGKGADNTSGAVRSSQAPAWNPQTPKMDINPSASLSLFYDLQMKEAQIDNLKVQNTVQLQEALLKKAMTANVEQNTESSVFDLGLKGDLRGYSLESKKEELRKLKQGIDIDLQANERAAAMNSANLLTAAENVLNLRAQRANTDAERDRIREGVSNLKKDGILKELDIDLKRNGIQPSDNIFLRILGRILSKYGIGVEDLPPSSFKP